MCTSTSLKTLRTYTAPLNSTQHVNDGIVSYNSNVSLIWFDKNTCLQNDEDVNQTKQMLRDIQANVTFHSDLDNFLQFLHSNAHEIFFLIISGVAAADSILFQRIHALKQIDSIFIFCLAKQSIRQQHSKIIGIFNTQLELCSNIRKTFDYLRRQYAAFSLFNQNQQSMRDLTNDSIRFLWYQLLKDILWKMPRTNDWKTRMIENCRDYYRNNVHELKHIEEFDTQYQSIEAIKWYTKDTFVYKLINQALRTEDIDALYVLRYYIEDLCTNLKNKYEQFRQLQLDLEMPDVTLYRGLRLERNQLVKLKINQGNLISTNGFLSASRSNHVAKLYAGWDVDNQSATDTTEPVLFIINIDVNEHNIIVADIADESQMPDELEVLFDLGSIFKIDSITEDNTQQPSKWTIIMTASNDGNPILNDYIMFKREEMEIFDIQILFGEFLYDMGEFKKAEKYFQNLLSTEDTPERRYSLGTVYALKGEYNRALDSLENACNQYYQILSSIESSSANYFDILGQLARTLHSMAHIYFHTDNSDQALLNYTAALNLYRTVIINDDSPHIGGCLQSIGLIYERRAFYDDAMEKFEQTNEIYSRTLPENHPERAGLLLNIGNIYKSQSHDDLAIKSFIDALEIMKKIYPTHHPSIAECTNNIGLVHLSNKRYDDALEWFFQCVENYNSSDLSIKQKILYADIYAYIAEIYEAEKNLLDAIRYYDQSLIIYQTIPNEHFLPIESNDLNISNEQNEEKRSLTSLVSALEEFEKIYPKEHPQIISCLHQIGEMFFDEKKYADAFDYYKQSLDRHKQDDLYRAECLEKISLIYQMQGDYPQALKYAINSYEILRKNFSSKHPMITKILKNILQFCTDPIKASFYSRELSLAVEKETSSRNSNIDHVRYKLFELYYRSDKYREALNIVSSKTDQFEDEQSQIILGQIYLKLDNFEQAIIHSKNALQLSSNNSNIARCYTQIGHASMLQHDHANALIFYLKCLEYHVDVNEFDSLENIYGNLAKIYSEKQDLKMALFYSKKSLSIAENNDSSNVESLLFDISQIHFQMENLNYGLDYLRQCIEFRQAIVDDDNDPELITYKEILAFSQSLFNANKRKRKSRKKYKRLFHRRHYQRRKKNKNLLIIPAEYSDLMTQCLGEK